MDDSGWARVHGSEVRYEDGVWIYLDGTLVEGNPRPCPTCASMPTVEGHDGCLGTLPGVRFACCGHGDSDCAYVMFEDGHTIRGVDALTFMASSPTTLRQSRY